MFGLTRQRSFERLLEYYDLERGEEEVEEADKKSSASRERG